MVGHQRLIGAPSAAGEFWRVQNHRIELLALLDERVERLKSIATIEPDTFETVEFGVSARLRNGSFAAVDAEDFLRPAQRRGRYREAARIAKHVEHPPAAHIP